MNTPRYFSLSSPSLLLQQYHLVLPIYQELGILAAYAKSSCRYNQEDSSSPLLPSWLLITTLFNNKYDEFLLPRATEMSSYHVTHYYPGAMF